MKYTLLLMKMKFLVLVLLLSAFWTNALSQAQFTNSTSLFWLNTYGNININDKLFVDNQFHFRFREKHNFPMLGQFAQIYARQGLGYIFSKNINATFGTVFRLNNNPNRMANGEVNTTSEFRLWHQYQFAMPLDRVYVYHRLRIEHRWSKGFDLDSEYVYRNRYRYRFNLKIPLNSNVLKEKTFYLAPETEVILQSGKVVGGSPLEDLRLIMAMGYIANRNLIFASSFMHTFGQDLAESSTYNQRFALRFHLYYFLDFENLKRSNLPFNFLY